MGDYIIFWKCHQLDRTWTSFMVSIPGIPTYLKAMLRTAGEAK
jgi:hypothetical protein